MLIKTENSSLQQICCLLAMHQSGLADCSQVDMLVLHYTSLSFGAGKSPGSLHFETTQTETQLFLFSLDELLQSADPGIPDSLAQIRRARTIKILGWLTLFRPQTCFEPFPGSVQVTGDSCDTQPAALARCQGMSLSKRRAGFVQTTRTAEAPRVFILALPVKNSWGGRTAN